MIMRAILSILLFSTLFAVQVVHAGLDEGIAAFESDDMEKALVELQPLAMAGQVQAMTWLGRVYSEGMDDPVKAFPWFLKAAQKGDAEAQTRLGESYAEGMGVEQDEEQALFWFEKAALQGDDEAQLALGTHQEEVLADNAAALVWYEKSAEQGNSDAQYRLGLLLLGEPGVPRQSIRAWVFLSLAAQDEVDEASEARDVLELGMSQAELMQAKQQLHEWKKSHP